MAPPDLADPTFEILRQRCEKNAAQRDVALASLGLLTAYVRRVGGYMTSDDQQVLRNAENIVAAWTETSVRPFASVQRETPP